VKEVIFENENSFDSVLVLNPHVDKSPSSEEDDHLYMLTKDDEE